MKRIVALALLFLACPAMAITNGLYATITGLGKSSLTCLDKDGDGYGTGEGCLGPDADDDDYYIHNAAGAVAKYGTLDLFFQHRGYSATRYWCLSTTGNNGTGTSSTTVAGACALPFQTWSGVKNSIGAGDMILWRGGTYGEQINNPPSGTSTATIVYMAYPGELPIIDASLFGGNNAIFIIDKSYWVIDGLKVKGGAGGACIIAQTSNGAGATPLSVGWKITHTDTSGAGSDSNINGNNGLKDVLITENVAHDPNVGGQHNIYLGSHDTPSTNVTVSRNILYNDITTGGYPQLQFNGHCDHCTFEQNLIYQGNGGGMSLIQGVSSSTVRGNVIYNNHQQAFVITDYDDHSGAVLLPEDQNYNLIENNTFIVGSTDWNGDAITSENSIPVYITNVTTAYSCGVSTAPCGDLGHNTFRNNIIVGGRGDDFYPPIVYTSSTTNYLQTSTFTNNLFWYSGTTGTKTVGWGHQLSFGYFPYDFSQLAGTTTASGNIVSTPVFTGYSNGNWYTPGSNVLVPLSTSPAVFNGSTVWTSTSDLYGITFTSAPPMGAVMPRYARGWKDLTSTAISPICPSPSPGGSGGCAQVFRAWSGGMARQKAGNEQMIYWGGGHADYFGNEVYSVNLFLSTPTVSLARGTDYPPSPFNSTTANDTYYANGMPVSRHTYYGTQYLPLADRFFHFEGVKSPTSTGGGWTWTADFSNSTFTWHAMEPFASGNGVNCNSATPGSGKCDPSLSSGSQGAICAYDPIITSSDTVLCVQGLIKWILRYNFQENTWTDLTHSNFTIPPNNAGAVIDPNRKKMFFIGDDGTPGVAAIWWMDVSTNTNWQTMHDVTSLSTGTCAGWADTNYPGMEYVPSIDKIIGWPLNGGNTYYAFNPDTYACSTFTFTGGSATGSSQGQFGRLRYFPSLDRVVLASDYNLDAYALTLSSTTVVPSTGTASLFMRVSPGPFNGTGGVSLSSPFVTQVVDKNFVPVQGASVTWTVTAGTAGSTFSSNPSITDSKGWASTTFTPVWTGGNFTVQASSSTLSNSPLTFAVSASAGSSPVSNRISGAVNFNGGVTVK